MQSFLDIENSHLNKVSRNLTNTDEAQTVVICRQKSDIVLNNDKWKHFSIREIKSTTMQNTQKKSTE